jgi:hypothetical protein
MYILTSSSNIPETAQRSNSFCRSENILPYMYSTAHAAAIFQYENAILSP